MYTYRRFFFLLVLLTVVFVVGALVPVQAQTPTPNPVGFRSDAPPYGVHGPDAVGVMQFEAKTPSHPTKVVVWYPAAAPKGAKEATTYAYDYYPDTGTLPIAGRAYQDAAPDTSGGPYPLVVFVPGWGSNRYESDWLCEHLASYGFVVMAMDQIDHDNAPNLETATMEAMVRRPQEVTWQIDYAVSLTASGGKLPGMIDTHRVTVAGRSAGGYTALMAAGGRLDWDYASSWCRENHQRAVMPKELPVLGGRNWCDLWVRPESPGQMAKLTGVEVPQAGLWPSWGDSRVAVIVALAPQNWPFVGPNGAKGVSVPMLLLGGSGDRFAMPEWYVQNYENVSSPQKALVTFENADHQIFWFGCDTAPWLVPNFAWTCSDPVWDMDRVHDLANHFVTAFLLDVIKGDKDAHKALLPDAVKFPGIEYKTTMK